MKTLPVVLSTTIGLLYGTTVIAAQSSSPVFTAEVGAGMQYDSSVALTELDQKTADEDSAITLDADFELKLPLSTKTEVSTSYGYSQLDYDTFSEFDMQTHFLSAGVAHDFGGVETGLTYNHIIANLDGEGFLTLQQASPFVSGFVSKKVFVRGSYTASEKEFDDFSERDADADTFGADAYYFINGSRAFVVAGYKFKTEDAESAVLDYDAHNYKLKYSQKLNVGELESTFSIGWNYEERDYDTLDAAIGDERSDKRHRYQAELEVPLTEQLQLVAEYEYASYQSNLESADFNQHVAGVRVSYSF